MPSGINCVPGRWAETTVLFDNGTYSVVTGKYDDNWALGERWNGEAEEVGFPSQGGNPLWHVVPDFLALPILHALLDELGRNPTSDAEAYAERLAQEIREWNEARTSARSERPAAQNAAELRSR